MPECEVDGHFLVLFVFVLRSVSLICTLFSHDYAMLHRDMKKWEIFVWTHFFQCIFLLDSWSILVFGLHQTHSSDIFTKNFPRYLPYEISGDWSKLIRFPRSWKLNCYYFQLYRDYDLSAKISALGRLRFNWQVNEMQFFNILNNFLNWVPPCIEGYNDTLYICADTALKFEWRWSIRNVNARIPDLIISCLKNKNICRKKSSKVAYCTRYIFKLIDCRFPEYFGIRGMM